MKDAKACDLIARVLNQPQNAQYVLDVRRLQEAQYAGRHDGDVEACELGHELRAMIRRSEENGLSLHRHARFARLEDALDPVPDQIATVAHSGEGRLLSRGSVRG